MVKKKKPAIYAPHIPAGIVEVRELKEIAEKLERAGAEKVKLTGEIIFILGENKLDAKVKDSLPYPGSRYDVLGIRGVKVCSATTYCDRNLQDVLSLALELDKLFYGMELPMKLTIGLSGCIRSCSEPAIKDVGIIAQPDGYKVLLGGSAGMNPSLGRPLAVLSTPEEVIGLIRKVVTFCQENGRKMVRLGKLIDEKGEESFKDFLIK